MTDAPHLSMAERIRVAAFEAAPYPPEVIAAALVRRTRLARPPWQPAMAARRPRSRPQVTADPTGPRGDREWIVGVLVRNGVWPLAVAERAADALMPVVEQIAEARAIARARQEPRTAAERLRQIVDEMEDDESIGIPPHVPLLIKALREVTDSLGRPR